MEYSDKLRSLDKISSHIKTIALVAGEHSGDSYGAMLINQLRKQYPDAKYIGIGGKKMQAAGLQSFVPMETLSVIGIVNVIKQLPQLVKLKNNLVNYLISNKIDLYIGIDAPDFNLVVARKIKKISVKSAFNIKTVQYISPTVWAWRPGRIFTVAKATDLVLCIFPFEEKIYRDHLIPAAFVGHPLTDKLQRRDETLKVNKLKKIEQIVFGADGGGLENKRIISLFPGSRAGEIHALSEVFINTAVNLKKQAPPIHFMVPLVSNKIQAVWHDIFTKVLEKSDDGKIIEDSITLINLDEYKDLTSIEVMQASDAILCASGTTTLEAFLLGVPMVVAYKVSKLNEWLIKLLIKVNYVAMPNILSDKLFGGGIVPEFLQNDVTVDNLTKAVLQQLNNTEPNNTKGNWHKIQDYLTADTQTNHAHACIKSITKILS